MNRRSLILLLLGCCFTLRPSGLSYAQQPPKDCTVRKEPNGLIRGDRIPRGCVLVNEDDATKRAQRLRHAELGACADLTVHIVFVPNPKHVTLTNGTRICSQVVSALQAREEAGDGNAFGPLDRPFGPLERHFGPLQRHFGRLERHFGPTKRHFGPSSRPASRAPARP